MRPKCARCGSRDPEDDCRTCGQHYCPGGDGYDGECPDCADRTEAHRLAREARRHKGWRALWRRLRWWRWVPCSNHTQSEHGCRPCPVVSDDHAACTVCHDAYAIRRR